MLVLVAGLAAGQQPNSPTASLIINAVDGPPFPIVTTIETNALVSVLIQGLPNSPFAILDSPSGQLQPGAAMFFGDTLDLPLVPLPIIAMDGFQPGSPFHTNANGVAGLLATAPPSTLGAMAACQGLIA